MFCFGIFIFYYGSEVVDVVLGAFQLFSLGAGGSFVRGVAERARESPSSGGEGMKMVMKKGQRRRRRKRKEKKEEDGEVGV